MSDVSLVMTILNEEDTIEKTIESILAQTKKPDEVIIVDGGSRDRTVEKIKKYTEKYPYIKLLVRKGTNIAQGRNIAIKEAKNEIIAVTDGGCWLDPHWLENITKPFYEDPTVDVVAGFYKEAATNLFQETVANLTYPKLERINPEEYLPSSRSIAFKKSAWEQVGGYPEYLATGEDTLFDIRLKKANMKFVFAPDAIVFWQVRKNTKELYKQFYGYAVGNARARTLLHIHLKQIAVFLSGLALAIAGFNDPVAWFFLAMGFPLYLLVRTVPKMPPQMLKPKPILMAMGISLIIDIASVVGFVDGLTEPNNKNTEKENNDS